MVGISDGSYFPLQEAGACAQIIATPDGNAWVEGGGVITGLPSDQHIYRSKFGGQLGIASFVSSVNLSNGNYILKTAYDGLSTLRDSVEHDYIRCSSKHVDILSIITELWEKSKFSFVK